MLASVCVRVGSILVPHPSQGSLRSQQQPVEVVDVCAKTTIDFRRRAKCAPVGSTEGLFSVGRRGGMRAHRRGGRWGDGNRENIYLVRVRNIMGQGAICNNDGGGSFMKGKISIYLHIKLVNMKMVLWNCKNRRFQLLLSTF